MATLEYLNFELNIEALGGNQVRVSLNDSPIGSVTVDVTNPFTPEEIARVISVMDRSIDVTQAERLQVGRTFGEKLFNTIFFGQIFAAYLASQDRAGSAGLRVRLGV